MSFFIPNQSLISYLSLRCGTETLPATVVKDNSRSRLKRQRERLIASKKLVPWHASHCGASHQCDKINSVRESQSQTKAARRSSTRETEKVPVLRILRPISAYFRICDIQSRPWWGGRDTKRHSNPDLASNKRPLAP